MAPWGARRLWLAGSISRRGRPRLLSRPHTVFGASSPMAHTMSGSCGLYEILAHFSGRNGSVIRSRWARGGCTCATAFPRTRLDLPPADYSPPRAVRESAATGRSARTATLRSICRVPGQDRSCLLLGAVLAGAGGQRGRFYFV